MAPPESMEYMRVYTKPNNCIESAGSTMVADQILEAALVGNLRRLKKLGKEMDDGRGMSETVASVHDAYGKGVLHYAAKKGRINVCKYLVEELKLPVDEKDHEGFTPLLFTTHDGHLSTMQYLVENGADPASPNNCNSTALHISAANGHIEMMKYLLSKGIDVNALNAFGTPLEAAALYGHRDALKFLLDAPCASSLPAGHIEMMKYLLSKGIDVNALNAFGTPLEAAALYGHRDALKFLLDHGADPNLVLLNASPLVIVMYESLECAELLIKARADPNGISRGRTPLSFAATQGGIEVIKFLLEAGADPNISDNIGLKPIERAARRGKHGNVEILFPVTAPIPACSDWSISGIMEHVESEDFKHQVELRRKEKYLRAKSNGDDALRGKDYLLASIYYGEAIKEEPSDATLFSIRSLCFASIGDGNRALSDAEACIKLRPDWPEAYYRYGVALSLLGEMDMATDAFLLGLKKDPENKDLREAFREVVQAKLNSFDI